MALIGEGSYGKVFRPPKNCNGKKIVNNSVGKIFDDKNDYLSQVNIATKVKSMNTRNIFSIPFYQTCDDNLQIIYGDGGMDLQQYTSSYKNIHFTNILKNMKLICQGIKILIQNDYVHQDIKRENIVYNQNKNKLYLIDFGLMTHTNEIYQNHDFLNYDYLAFPPEYKESIYHKDFKPRFFRNFKGNKQLLQFIKTFYTNWKNDLKSLIENPSYPTDKIDIYSLGIVICYLYKWYNVKNTDIESLIIGMICFDPKKRWEIDSVLKWFK